MYICTYYTYIYIYVYVDTPLMNKPHALINYVGFQTNTSKLNT